MTPERERLERLLADYELGAELGRGSFGVVWAAKHRQLGRDVAVKQLVPSADEAGEARFRREARLLAGLRHPHVVSVFDYREAADVRALIMESLTGGTLAERRASMSFESILVAVLAAASALHHVHLEGVLHRDVKPENIMFDAEGRLRVTDFGVAGGRTDATDATAIGVTLSGSFTGTVAYAAPEQCGSVLATGWPEPGASADQYALAVVLFESLTGELPHDRSGGILPLSSRKMNEPPLPLGGFRPDLPPPLTAAAMRALARSPADRYESMEAFGVALATAASTTLGPGWADRSGVALLDPGPIHAAAFSGAAISGPAAIPEPPPPLVTTPPAPPEPPAPPTSPAAPPGRPTGNRRALIAGAAAVVIAVGGATAFVMTRDDKAADTPTTTAAPAADASTLRVAWSVRTGAGLFSSPVEANGRVVVGSDDGTLYGVETDAGTVAWKLRTEGPIRSSPAVAGDHVVVGGNDGKLRSVDVATGVADWTTPVDFKIISSPVVLDNQVIVGADHLRSFDLATGAAGWVSTSTGPIVSSPAIAGQTIIVGSEDGSVYGVAAGDGAVVWQLRTGDAVQSSPVIAGDVAIVGSRDGNLYAIDAATGALRWSADLGAMIKSSPAIVGDRVVVGTDAGTLVAVGLADGQQAWSFKAGDSIDSSPLVVGSQVIVGSNDHRVHVVDADTGLSVSSYETGGPVLSTPLQLDADVVVSSEDGVLYRLTGLG